MPSLSHLNFLDKSEALEAFTRCCGASRWAAAMEARRPFASTHEVTAAADGELDQLSPEDWLEAFRHHPKIGDISALRAKFASTANWAQGEQSGTASADEATLQGLAAGNDAYEAKFGFIFIICATGKSAAEMLSALEARLPHTAAEELEIAAGEQRKITHLRLAKLLSE